jgi:hypothetical protein
LYRSSTAIRATGHLSILLSVCLLAFLSISCATQTEISSEWKSPEYAGGPMHKILVVAVAETPLGRREYEDRFAEALRGSGAEAVSSYQILPGDERLTKEELEDAIRGEGFDGVIVSRLLGVDEETTYVPPTTEVVPSSMGYGRRGYYGYYGRGYDVVRTPGYTQTTEIVSLETKLWNAEDSQLAWGIRSETFDPKSNSDAMDSVVKKLVRKLADDGLLAK